MLKPVATESILFRSPSPQDTFCYSPSICCGASGRLIASFDLGGAGVARLEGPKSDNGDFGLANQLRILVSDDRGATWRETARLPMMHTRLFRAGGRLYALGQSGRLLISASSDNGESWSSPAVLEADSRYEPGASIDFHNGRLYLEMERKREFDTWPGVEQVLLSAEESDDLTRPESYTREVAIEDFWGDGEQSSTTARVWVDGGWTMTEAALPGGAVRHTIVGAGPFWLWYDGDSTALTGPADERSADLEGQRIPTYEDILALDTADIAAAGYEERGGLACVWAETVPDALGYVETYWVAVDSGLLVSAETTLDGALTYRMTAYAVERPAPAGTAFQLPDGTVLHTTGE